MMRAFPIVKFLFGCVLAGPLLSCQEDKPTELTPASLTLVQPGLTVQEPDHAGSGVRIPLVRSRSLGAVSASVEVLAGSAGDADFRCTDPRARFEDGADTAWVFVELLSDTLAEGDETFAVRLDSIPPRYVAGERTEEVIRIADRLAPPGGPTVSFLQPEITVREGERTPPYRARRIPIVRSNVTGSLTLPVAVIYVTASPGDLGDWGRPSSELRGLSGADTLWISIEPEPDAEIEGDEVLTIRLGQPPAPYSLGWWPELTVRIQDVEVHHDAMPTEWPLAVGNSSSYEFEWQSGVGGSFDWRLPASAEITGEMRFRGRDYRVFRTSQYRDALRTVRHSILLANVADSLLFIPTTDTTGMSASLKDSLPWVLATFSGPDSVDRSYPSDRPWYGRQRRVGPVSVPAGSWENVLQVTYGRGCGLDSWPCLDGGDAWTFYLAKDVGPIQFYHQWCDPDVNPDDTCGFERADLTIGPRRR